MPTSGPARAVIIVEDDEVKRYTVSRLLREIVPVQIQQASTCAEARLLAAQEPELMVLDVLLPDGNGIELTRELKRAPETAPTSILLVSSTFGEPEARVAGLEAGADACLALPANPRELQAVVRALLRLGRLEREHQRFLVEEALAQRRSAHEARAHARAAHEGQEHFRGVASGLGAMLFEQDLELRYSWVGHALSGLGEGGMLGRVDAELFIPEEAQVLGRLKLRALSGERLGATVPLTVAGQRRAFVLHLAPHQDESGRVLGVVGCLVPRVGEASVPPPA